MTLHLLNAVIIITTIVSLLLTARAIVRLSSDALLPWGAMSVMGLAWYFAVYR